MISSKKIYFIVINNNEYYSSKNLYIPLNISYKFKANKFKSILKQGN